jgi:hypothetical protein
MGYLDHSTNNIILDAVLTDYGRQKLALGNGGFNITHYGLGDDEVDYRLIKRYGRTVGKEKIEKNTPIFEALTNQNIALKYRLIGRENEGTPLSSVYLPTLKCSSNLDLKKPGTLSKVVTVDLYFGDITGNAVPTEMIQQSYKIKISDRFFKIDTPIGGTLTSNNLVNSGDTNRIATYTFTTKNSASTSISFTVTAKSTIDNTTLSVYGRATGNLTRKITSYITVTGERHGCTIDIPVTYESSLT